MPAKPKPKINDNGQETVSPIIIKDSVKFYTGSTFTSTSGDKYIVESYDGRGTGVVRFLDEYGYRTSAPLSRIKSGQIRNKYHPNKYGGFVGDGEYQSTQNDRKIHTAWRAVLVRTRTNNVPSYENTTVCEEWLDRQAFAAWYLEYRSKINPKYHDELEINKDILQWNQVEKKYSPQTCCLVPSYLNNFLNGVQGKIGELPRGVYRTPYGTYSANISSGHRTMINLGTYATPEEAFEAYKRAKKEKLIELANMYYSDGAILPDIYEALCNLEIAPY